MSMLETTHRSGMKLQRHFLSDADLECGTEAMLLALADQYQKRTGYYTLADGTHKCMRHIIVRVFTDATNPDGSYKVTMPQTFAQAYCNAPDANGVIVIDIRYFSAAKWGSYKFPAALSHEWGHARHFWAGMYIGANSYAREFERFWERAVSSNHTTFNSTLAPWRKADGGVEDGREQIANASRCFLGTDVTYHQSGPSSPGGVDQVIPGFEDPMAHPDWEKMLSIWPEALAFAKKFGVLDNSLMWLWDNTKQLWYFQFQTTNAVEYQPGCVLPAKSYVRQDDYWTWFKWEYVPAKASNDWVPFWPQYSLI